VRGRLGGSVKNYPLKKQQPFAVEARKGLHAGRNSAQQRR
jgi:hypothetical protein